MLDAATRLNDLRSPPGNRLEVLKGDRGGSARSASMISFAAASAGRTRGQRMWRSLIITEEKMPMNRMRPIHPGEILREEYLKPLGMSANALAHAIGVPANRVSLILSGKRAITADTALRLSRAFDTSPSSGSIYRSPMTYVSPNARAAHRFAQCGAFARARPVDAGSSRESCELMDAGEEAFEVTRVSVTSRLVQGGARLDLGDCRVCLPSFWPATPVARRAPRA
jgi:addiction module HigA family antidote